MIAYIKGELVILEEDRVIVDVGGVGYGIYMPGRAMSALPPIGSEVLFHTYLNVKEDAMQLYGFLTRDDLAVFRKVITVSGIGPRGGLSILSQLSADDLRFAVMSGDAKAISAAQGIGKKTAEKLILELKDKLSMPDLEHYAASEDTSVVSAATGGIQQDAVSALVALGYGNTEALKAVRQVELTEGMNVEDVLKQALKYMMF